ncbi:hypothetical protein HY638_02500 [Candidatus Woesearchaeota archaeon]|nr:hypothetical protein [Candidatus Woesearchaeota archaeon]
MGVEETILPFFEGRELDCILQRLRTGEQIGNSLYEYAKSAFVRAQERANGSGSYGAVSLMCYYLAYVEHIAGNPEESRPHFDRFMIMNLLGENPTITPKEFSEIERGLYAIAETLDGIAKASNAKKLGGYATSVLNLKRKLGFP